MTTRTYGDDLDVDTSNGKTPKTKNPTVYDQLRAELGKPSNAVKEAILKVPSREHVSVRFNTDLTLAQLDRWRKSAEKSGKNKELDILEFNLTIIVSQAQGILFNGIEAKSEEDDRLSLNFRSPELLEMLNSLDPKGAVKVLYDRDADILKIGNDILEIAGYGDEVDEDDPLI